MDSKDFENWHVVDEHPNRHVIDIKAGPYHVATLCTWDENREQQRRNATLMIAARDLLVACESAMRIVDLWGPNEFPTGDGRDAEMQALSKMKSAFEAAIAKATTVNIVRTAAVVEEFVF